MTEFFKESWIPSIISKRCEACQDGKGKLDDCLSHHFVHTHFSFQQLVKKKKKVINNILLTKLTNTVLVTLH